MLQNDLFCNIPYLSQEQYSEKWPVSFGITYLASAQDY